MTVPDRPRLRRGVRLTFDEVRSRHVLLYPEGVLLLNESAAAVLSRCDGDSDLAVILADLDAEYRGVRAEDITDLLAGLAARHLVDLRPAEASHA